MQRFYSPSIGGFFSEDIHGPRQIDVGDPPQPAPNPDCLIPADAVPVDDDLWRQLLAATSEGQIIAMVDGQPAAIDPAAGGQH